MSVVAVAGPVPSAAADPDTGFTGIDPRAQICDVVPSYYSTYLNAGAAMPAVGSGAGEIQVTIDNSAAYDTQGEVNTALSGKVRIRVAANTPLATLNWALAAPNGTNRTFYFYAEQYNYSDPLVVTQQLKLLGTRTKSNGTSASGNRTTLSGGNTSNKLTAITASGTSASYVEIAYLTIQDYGRNPV